MCQVKEHPQPHEAARGVAEHNEEVLVEYTVSKQVSPGGVSR